MHWTHTLDSIGQLNVTKRKNALLNRTRKCILEAYFFQVCKDDSGEYNDWFLRRKCCRKILGSGAHPLKLCSAVFYAEDQNKLVRLKVVIFSSLVFTISLEYTAG